MAFKIDYSKIRLNPIYDASDTLQFIALNREYSVARIDVLGFIYFRFIKVSLRPTFIYLRVREVPLRLKFIYLRLIKVSFCHTFIHLRVREVPLRQKLDSSF